MKRPVLKAAIAAALGAAVVGVVAVQHLSFAGTAEPAAASKPNIVFVLTDDLSWNLVQFLPQVKQMQAEGMTFRNMTVTDSLCCPSRSSILTGKFPHNTKVFTNDPDDGGFAKFFGEGNEQQTFATSLRAGGYRTGFMGKYLNGYNPGKMVNGQKPYNPPGWDTWVAAGDGYPELDYDLAVNNTIEKHGHTDADFLVDVMATKGTKFAADAAAANKPFMLELATFAPHAPFTSPKRHQGDFPGLTAPKTAAFNTKPTNAPPWLANLPAIAGDQLTKIDNDFRKRAKSVQAVDDMIRGIRAQLARSGVANNTYLIFGSDNGFHMGEHGVMNGKQTAFDTDVNVPLVVVGPGVKAGSVSTAEVSNIDLAPTFQTLGGVPVPATVDGHSLAGLLHGDQGEKWRDFTLVEHHHSAQGADDPDRQSREQGDPPTYYALRNAAFTYVEYDGGAKEYYNNRNDPLQLHNVVAQQPAARLQQLHTAMQALRICRGQAQCWQAGQQ